MASVGFIEKGSLLLTKGFAVKQCILSLEMKEEIKDFKKELTDITGQMSKIDFEHMSFFLSFQNVPELPNENLRELMATMLADYIKKDKELIWGDIDLIYGINSAFARINEVPREIHIKFLSTWGSP